MINEIILGFGLGVLWIGFVAWIDSRLPPNLVKQKRIQIWIMATAWETLYLVAGIVIGRYLLKC